MSRVLFLFVALLPAQALADDAPYAKYDALLRRYVDEQGMVDYAAFKANDERALRACVEELAGMDPARMGSAAKKAYWINVYNAVTLQAMLEFWPLESIKDKVSSLPGGYDVWDDYGFGPKKLSLNHVEHQILRKMGDPRVHAAIVCASRGCPILLNAAYVPAKLDAQLDASVRKWLRDPKRGLKLAGDEVLLSKIFSWFGDDFAEDEAGRLAWIARYVAPGVAKKLRSGALEVDFLDWDWSINAQ